MTLLEQRFLEQGHLYRPFSKTAEVSCRSASLPLQRAVTDLGADLSFEQTAQKLKEHYGLDMAPSTLREVTEKHAKALAEWEPYDKTFIEAPLLIAEMDGSMVPIVETGGKEDLRKTRKTCWKEVKLCFTRVHQKIARIYAGKIGSVEEAGQQLYQCAKRSGYGPRTHVHALGDGAQWIIDQIDQQFGVQAYFLVDFFHLCEYLGEASKWVDVLNPEEWFKQSREKIKQGKTKQVLEELKGKKERLGELPEEHALVKCIRYMEKRLKNMDYKKALARGLPIGSGEIESSHRHVIQKRLKIAGAWWKEENANAMIALRTARMNGYWEEYWSYQNKAA